MTATAGRAEVIVVGGGQAGLTAGYYLSEAGIPYLILDAGPRAGESWRQRWDSLELFTPARYSSLPGLSFQGRPWHYPGKDEVADYLQAYAARFALPVRHRTRVTSLEPAAGGYRLHTSEGTYEAAQVIVATGAYQRPFIPPIAGALSPGVTQLHSSAYRIPGQMPGPDVLVVGAANSGAQIAADLSHTHRVWLSQGARIPRLPRRILGIPLHAWGDRLGLVAAPLGTWRGRTQRGDLLVGTSLRQLARRHHVSLLGRAVSADGRTVRFAGGQQVEVSAVMWATGYQPDYSWIHVPVFGPDGHPRHQRGTTSAPGLYFLGMHNQYSRGSSLIHWVRHDAAYIVGRARAAAANSAAGTGAGNANPEAAASDRQGGGLPHDERDQAGGPAVTNPDVDGLDWNECRDRYSGGTLGGSLTAAP
ncbi:MAG: NAD(P)/FAD-dependent oxidoreductase [Actinomycetota bacterium]|nr:NAD(P)/FAD-dependent oxidoreductase [Actinomycetota bacterium]